MIIENFDQTLHTWTREIDQCNYLQLCTKPSPISWSIGQDYLHLLADAHYYLEQIKICLSNNDNMMEESSAEVNTMFSNNDFPDQLIEGSPSNANIPQPSDKEQLAKGMNDSIIKINQVVRLVSNSHSKGKTKHPELGYFSAKERLQLAEMHFRHHRRQKKRIDDFLKINGF